LLVQLPKPQLLPAGFRSCAGQRPREQGIYLANGVACIFPIANELGELCILHREPPHGAAKSIPSARDEGFLSCRECLDIEFRMSSC
jgi:hypothetical protein